MGEAGQFVQGSQPMILKNLDKQAGVHTVQCSYGVAQFAVGRIETRNVLECAGIVEQSILAYRKGLSYRPARLHRLAESIPRNQFLRSVKVKKIPSQGEDASSPPQFRHRSPTPSSSENFLGLYG
jgi:hypothetical protein